MNHVRKLALHGMRGRRKDTRVLALVIVMSFLFLTAGTLLLSSFSGSQARQRQSLYGGWHLLYGGGDSRVAESLTGLSQVAETAEVTLLGVDGQCGQVAAWSEDFARMGSLQIVEGRAPVSGGNRSGKHGHPHPGASSDPAAGPPAALRHHDHPG